MKVSVLTPIYNHDVRYVRQCLESLKNQTLRDMEFILIDNGANQVSKDLINEFLKKDARFKVLHLENNEGYGKAMNTGLNAATGEYIGIVESDDFVGPIMYETLYKIGKENNVDLVKSLFSFKEEGKELKLALSFKPGQYNKALKNLDVPDFCYKYGSYWSAIYKREMLDRHQIRWEEQPSPSAEDIMWTLKTYFFCRSLYISHRCFYHYRVDNPNSSIRGKDDKVKRCMDLYLKLNAYLERKKYEMLDEYWYIKSRREFLNFWWAFQAGHVSLTNWRLFLQVAKQLRYNWEEGHVRLGPLETHLYKKLAFHPIRTVVENVCFKQKKKGNKIENFFLFFPWKISCSLPSGQKTSYFGGLYRVERCNKDAKKYLCALPFYTRVKKPGCEVRSILGIPIYRRSQKLNEKLKPLEESFRHIHGLGAKLQYLVQSIQRIERIERDIDTKLYAQAVHPGTFGPYLNCHTNQNVALVACGPSVKYFEGLKDDAVYVGVNRAFLIDKINLDYLFVQDDLGRDQEAANQYRHGKCRKFYGIIPHGRNMQIQQDPNLRHIRRLSLTNVSLADAKQYILTDSVYPHWPYDISREAIKDWGGTVFSALQFILYTNPKRIYLIGCDCTDGGHFNGGRKENFSSVKRFWLDFSEYKNQEFPHIELVSVNPIGLRGLFRDIYSRNFVQNDASLSEGSVEVLND